MVWLEDSVLYCMLRHKYSVNLSPLVFWYKYNSELGDVLN